MAKDAELVRRLADLEVEDGRVVSVYLNLDPSEFATGPARSSAITSLIDRASRAADAENGELSHAGRIALRDDIARIGDYLGHADFAGTHGVAVFAAGTAGVFETVHLPHPVESAVVIDAAPHVAPLAARREGPWLVVLVNTRDARILRGDLDGLAEVERVADDVHGRHDQGGWSQARYQRSIDEEARRHLRRVADTVRRVCARVPCEHVLAGGPDEPYSEFVGLLDRPLRDRLRGRIEIDVENPSPAHVAAVAAPLMREHERARQDELLARLGEDLAGGHAAAGLDDVLGSLNERRVGTLLLEPGYAAPGGECPHCGWISTRTDGDCPNDGAPLARRPDVVALAVDRALSQDAEVVHIPDRPEIATHGRIAALLRF